jgi:hypothetical protein
MNPSPITLFVYNRPIHTKKTVQALLKNKLASKSILYIFSDYPKKEEHIKDVKQVREYIHTIKGFKEIHIIERKQNYGLAKSIIEGTTEVINKYRRVIVLEDDLVTSPAFLDYMNFLLDKYEKEKKIFSVTGYNYPPRLMKIPTEYKYDTYFSPRACSQAWGTWKDRWGDVDWEVKDYEEFKNNKQLQKDFNNGGEDMTDMLINQMEGKLDSWAIRWCYHHFRNKAFCNYPTFSFAENIGHDGSGVHSGSNNKFSQKELNLKVKFKLPPIVELNSKIMNNFKKVYKKNRLKKFILKIIKTTNIYKSYKKAK